MSNRAVLCLLLGSLAWGQATTTPSAAAPSSPPPQSSAAPAQSGEKTAPAEAKPAEVAPDAAVITLPGLCDKPPAENAAADPNCKTVVTRADFEALVNAIAPNLPPPGRRQLANRYAVGLVMAAKAEQMGLDKSPRFQELLKIGRTQALAQELGRTLQEQAGQVSEKDIKDYYDKNSAAFEEADLQRIYIPRNKQVVAPKGVKLTAAETNKRQQDGEVSMKAEATRIRAAAVAGEDWDKLQKEAFTAAGLKTNAPATSMNKQRRTALPANHASVWDLKPGEVSPLITDTSGYFLYKMGKKSVVPLDKVSDDIKATLRTQRLQGSMQAVQTSVVPGLNEAYFGPQPLPPGVQMKIEPTKPESKTNKSEPD